MGFLGENETGRPANSVDGNYSGYFHRELKELACMAEENAAPKQGVPFVFQSGATYVGQWKRSARHGYGLQTWPDGAKYDGEWNDNIATGNGSFTHSDGDVYIGQWKCNVASGLGI